MDRRQFLATMGGALGSQLVAAQPGTPSIVMIFADDLGYGDLGCYGSRIRTPNLDRMAAEGMRFTNCTSANPVCSPSRAALLTGRYPTRVGVPRVFFPQDADGLNLDETTMASMLKARNYATMCIGKWHLGRPQQYLPTSRGFDEYFGIPYSNDMTPRVLLHNSEVVEETATLETLTQRYTAQATKFIREKKSSPFFLYMPHTYPHIPLGASPRFRGKSAQGIYGDVIEELDWSVGEVLRTLKENNLDQNTLVMFSSDNGPWYLGSPGRFRGRKGSTYEGGIREPFIARWPGRIPKARVSDAQVSLMDVMPTVAGLCSAAKPSKPLDGIDIWPLLSGSTASLDRDPLLCFDGWELQCARWKQWKLHVSRFTSEAYNGATYATPRQNLTLVKPELYDLSADPDESYDVAPENPQVVADLQGRISAMVKSFPKEVQDAYSAAQARHADPASATGAMPRPVRR